MDNQHNYSRQSGGGFIDQTILRKREEMMAVFLNNFPAQNIESVLDVGVTADRTLCSTNYFENMFPYSDRITALSDQDASWMEDQFKGLTFKQGDARALPFNDKSFDIVFSSAVIEHVGNTENQKKMISEAVRIAKNGVFITTPNRWHPVDFHTVLPLLHWLPKSWHRWCLKKLKLEFFASEERLNLLGKKDIDSICQSLHLTNYDIQTISFFGFKSNLLLIIRL